MSGLVRQYSDYSADCPQALGTPTTPKATLLGAECGQRGRITPSQIGRAGRLATFLVELLRKPAVGWSVSCDNFNESVCMRADRIRELHVRT